MSQDVEPTPENELPETDDTSATDGKVETPPSVGSAQAQDADPPNAGIPNVATPNADLAGGPAERDESEEGADVQSGHEIAEAPVFTQSDVDAKLVEVRAESRDRFLRLRAEFENYRRRTSKERVKWGAEALQELVADLLPVFDSLDKARYVAKGEPGPVAEGLDLIERQLATALGKNEIERLDPIGEPFEPALQEALSQQPTAEHPPGTVVAVFEKGYTIQGRLVRPARVVVAAEPPESPAESPEPAGPEESTEPTVSAEPAVPAEPDRSHDSVEE